MREALRFIHQRERFFSALVRPLVWLGIFAAGFRSVLGVAIIAPYETYITYEVYIAPGLIAMQVIQQSFSHSSFGSFLRIFYNYTAGIWLGLIQTFPAVSPRLGQSHC